MQIKTKYKIGDIVKVGKAILRIKRIKIDIGVMLFHFNQKEQNVIYSLERADGAGGWAQVAEWIITGRATKKEWELEKKKAGLK